MTHLLYIDDHLKSAFLMVMGMITSIFILWRK